MAAHPSATLNEATPPIPDQLFGQLRQASPLEAVEMAKVLPEPQRARFASFCYNKRHLHVLGLMVASSCDRDALFKACGRAGKKIFEQSRDPNQILSAGFALPGSRPRKSVSLAGSSHFMASQ